MTPAKQRGLIVGLILIGLIAVGFFGMRSVRAFRQFRGHRPPAFFASGNAPAETDVELIRDWMTIGYISHTYRLPPRLLYETLGIRPNGNEDKNLKQLNDEYFPDKPGYVLETVKAAALAYLPPSTTIPPPTLVSTSTPIGP